MAGELEAKGPAQMRAWTRGLTTATAAIAACSAAVLLAACSSSGSSGGDSGSGIPAGDIVFGETLPLSGPYAQVGGFEKLGIDVDTSVLNAHGGIAGHNVKVITLDDKGDPATALANARKLIEEDHVAGILNGSLGPASALTVPYFMKAGIPTVLPEENSDFMNTSKYPTYFTPYASAPQRAAAWLAYAKAHNLHNFGIVSDGTPVATQAAAAFRQQASAAGEPVKASVTYSPTAVDVTTQVRQLKQAGVDTVIDTGFAEIQHIFAAINQIGWSPTVLGTGTGTVTAKDAGALLNKMFFECVYHVDSPSDPLPTGAAKEVLDQIAKVTGQGSTASSNGLDQYDMLLTLKAGIEKAQSLDFKAVTKAIESGIEVPSAWPGLTYKYSSKAHVGYPDNTLKMCGLSKLAHDGVGVLAP